MTYGNAHFRRWVHLCCAVVAALYFSLTAHATNVLNMSHSGSSGASFQGQSDGIFRINSIEHSTPAGVALTMPQVSVRWQFQGRYKGQGWASAPVVKFSLGGGTGVTGVGYPGPEGVYSISGAATGTATLDSASGKYYVTLTGSKWNGGAIVVGSEVTVWAWVDAEYKFVINVRNNTNGRVNYKVIQDGNVIDAFSLDAGGSRSKTYTTDSPSEVFVNQTPQIVFTDFTTGQMTGGGEGTSTNVPTDTPITPQSTSGGAPPPPAVDVTSPGVDGATTPTGATWQPETATQTANQLDKETFKTGVDALIKAVKSSGGGAGGEATDVSGIESRLDTANTKLDSIKNSATAQETRISDANSDTSDGGKVDGGNASSKASSRGTAVKDAAMSAGTSMQAAVGTAMSSAMPAAPSAVSEPSSAESDTIQLQIRPGQIISIPKNPLSPSGPFGGVLSDVAGFVKKLIAWGIVAAFVIWAHKRLQEMIEAPFNVAPFGTSISDAVNSVKVAGFGGGWGIVARLAVGAILLPILVTLPLAGVAALTAGLPWGEVKTVFSAGVGSLPSSGMLGKAFWLSDQVIPWVTLLTAPVWYFSVQYVLFPSKLFWMIFMKYVSV